MNAIAAVSASWGIGRDNALLFHISEDLKRFRALTTDGTVIMGRKTLESLPGGKPLPKRRNIVLTRDPAFSREGVETAHNLTEVFALIAAEDSEKVWVCGGGEVYRQLLPYCRRCCITRVYADPDCDVFFPDLDRLDQWEVFRAEDTASDGTLDYQFVDYQNLTPLEFGEAGDLCRT